MDKTTAQDLAEKNLDAFKNRMQIYSQSRDSDIERMLATSFQRIESLIGDYDENDDLTFVDLVYQRTRYDYNDQVEYFDDNFQHDILGLSLLKAEGESDD